MRERVVASADVNPVEVLEKAVTELERALGGNAPGAALATLIEGMRPRLLRQMPVLVPQLLGVLQLIDARAMLVAYGVSVTPEQAARLAPLLRRDRQMAARVVRVCVEKLMPGAPLDVPGLLDALVQDFAEYTRAQEQLRQRLGAGPSASA